MEITVSTVKEAKKAVEHIEALGLEVVEKIAFGEWFSAERLKADIRLSPTKILRWGRNSITATVDDDYGSERYIATINSGITIKYKEPIYDGVENNDASSKKGQEQEKEETSDGD